MRIVLMGKAGAGKDTVADYLVRRYGFTKYAFADALKGVARQLWPESFRDGQKPRKLLQDLGAKMRELDPNVWINVVFRRIANDRPKHVVVTDCRYPNELQACLAQGFAPVHVWCTADICHRRLCLRDGRGLTDEEKRHVSERLRPPDDAWTIDNIGTLDDLCRKVDDMMDSFGVLPDFAYYGEWLAEWLKRKEDANALAD